MNAVMSMSAVVFDEDNTAIAYVLARDGLVWQTEWDGTYSGDVLGVCYVDTSLATWNWLCQHYLKAGHRVTWTHMDDDGCIRGEFAWNS